jgi:hypothetical protein
LQRPPQNLHIYTAGNDQVKVLELSAAIMISSFSAKLTSVGRPASLAIVAIRQIAHDSQRYA